MGERKIFARKISRLRIVRKNGSALVLWYENRTEMVEVKIRSAGVRRQLSLSGGPPPSSPLAFRRSRRATLSFLSSGHWTNDSLPGYLGFGGLALGKVIVGVLLQTAD